MKIEEIIRLPEPQRNVKAEIREVVRDVAQKPHVFLRVRLSGWYFPQRAPEPFLVIGKVVSNLVLIDQDQKAADAYFDVNLPAVKRVSFGYGKIVSWDFDVAIDPTRIDRLDRTRLPEGYIDLKNLQRSGARRSGLQRTRIRIRTLTRTRRGRSDEPIKR
jgi:hypothetical protein